MEFLVTGKIQSLSKTFFEPLSLNHKTITAAEDIDSIIIGKHVKNYNCSPLDEDFLHLFHTHSFEGVVHFVDGLEASEETTFGINELINILDKCVLSKVQKIMSIFTYKNVVRYERTEGVFHNPLMGFAIDADQVEEAENHALVYVDVTFRELEPEEGTFDFEAIEKNNHLKRWKDSGKHVVFRFISDYPGSEEHLDIPDWLYEKIDGDGAFYNNSYGMGYAPNYNNPIFIEHHAKAIEALGKHFGQDHFFGFVQLGSLGHWGEWHSYFETGVDKIPDEETREQYILPYLKAFPNAKIMMRQPFEAADIHRFGIYNDMTGHAEETIDWLDTIQNGGQYDQTSEEGGLISMENAWKTVPIGGEFTSSIPMHEMIVQNIDQTLKLLEASHTTYLGPRVP